MGSLSVRRIDDATMEHLRLSPDAHPPGDRGQAGASRPGARGGLRAPVVGNPGLRGLTALPPGEARAFLERWYEN